MNLLNQPLVRAYFCETINLTVESLSDIYAEEKLAYRILLAMYEPIKKGEKYLNIEGVLGDRKPFEVDEGIWKWSTTDFFHPCALRLPDRFQTDCIYCHGEQQSIKSGVAYPVCEEHIRNPPFQTKDKVEEKINEISIWVLMPAQEAGHPTRLGIETLLRELVQVVRKQNESN